MPLPSPLRVLFLSSEADPLVKVGGLGDVGGSLPPALRALTSYLTPNGSEFPLKIDIRLVMPFHGVINQRKLKPKPVASFYVPHKGGPIQATAYEVKINQVPVYLIAGGPIDLATSVYSGDWGFDAHKYIFYSLAALELAKQIDFQPHIVHANDWHTASAIYWLSLNRDSDPFFNNTSTLLSVHNLPFMGVGGGIPLDSFYLPPAPEGILPDWARHLPLPLGLYAADHINAVSPTYGKEILTAEFGAGLEKFLKTRKSSISGILNGIDQERWNPENDANLSVPYSIEHLSVRQANKAALMNEVDFYDGSQDIDDHFPLFAMITRMDYQKGVDLVVEALRMLSRSKETRWRALILGTGLPELEKSVQNLQELDPKRIRAVLKFDAPLSHRIYAGADALLMPSRYEPCGLAQMIAMRYGCIPVARATGGLADTIIDVDTSADSTGFLFRKASPRILKKTMLRVLDLFQDQEKWLALQKRGMAVDFSWKKSALAYVDIYDKLVTRRMGHEN